MGARNGEFTVFYSLPKIQFGTKAPNVINDTKGDDWLFGLNGNDVFQIKGGRDFVSGGCGNDTAVFEGKFQNFKVCDTLFGLATKVEGKGVCTTLTSVETLVFDNGVYDNCTNKFTANKVTVAGGGTVTEGGALSFTFTRTGDLSRSYDATFTIDGTANAADFGLNGFPTKVTFAAGSATATVVLTSINDAIFEGTEKLKLSLTSDGCRYEVGSTGSSALGTILDAQSPLPNCFTLNRAGTLDGSSTADQVLTGIDGANSFFFSIKADSGRDVITNFGKHDVLVTDAKLLDNNNNGFIDFGFNGVLDLDLLKKTGDDQAVFDGYPPKPGLRYLGEACDGLHVYADGQVRPTGAIEGKFGADTLTGDAGDLKKQVFFFDTALELNLGADRINNFGAKDILVTTTKVMDANMNGIVDFGANGVLDESSGGTIAVTGLTSLEFDGAVTRDGVDYFVYSKVGSTAGVADLVFA